MASSRDDFIIAIRSAFLKKSTKQKFSLLTLIFLSIFIIILSSLNFKIIQQTKNIINEIVYRSSFIVSVPENLLVESYSAVKIYSSFYVNYKNNKDELEKLKAEEISSEIIKSENEELKNLIEDYTLTTNKILAKVIVDHQSPFLKTIIINKGSSEKIKIGTNIYNKSYLVGRVIEVNYKSSRVLLLSDLNSSIPVSIIPGNIQAIIVGTGKNSGKIKYVKGNFVEDIVDRSIAYTSGTGSIFKSGVPIGAIAKYKDKTSKDIIVNFYTDFTQLKYVFAEVEEDKKNTSIVSNQSTTNNSLVNLSNTEKIKLDLLNNEIEIFKETNSKFIKENKSLKTEINELEKKLLILQKEYQIQSKIIENNNLDKKELEFLRLNLVHSYKCRKTLFNDGFKVGSEKYKNCILKEGKKLND